MKVLMILGFFGLAVSPMGSIFKAVFSGNFAEAIPDNRGDQSMVFEDMQSGPDTTQSGVFRDSRDGNTYRYIQLGDQIWMVENLRYEIDDSWAYNGDTKNLNMYGRLYTWDAAMKACPEGWRLPSDDDWMVLERHIGLTGTGLEAVDYRGDDLCLKAWLESQGFNPVLGGCRTFRDGHFLGKEQFGFFWTSTSYKEIYAWKRAFDAKNGSHWPAFTQQTAWQFSAVYKDQMRTDS